MKILKSLFAEKNLIFAELPKEVKDYSKQAVGVEPADDTNKDLAAPSPDSALAQWEEIKGSDEYTDGFKTKVNGYIEDAKTFYKSKLEGGVEPKEIKEFAAELRKLNGRIKEITDQKELDKVKKRAEALEEDVKPVSAAFVDAEVAKAKDAFIGTQLNGLPDEFKANIGETVFGILQDAVKRDVTGRLADINKTAADAKNAKDPDKANKELDAAVAALTTVPTDMAAYQGSPEFAQTNERVSKFVAATASIISKFEQVKCEGDKCEAAKKGVNSLLSSLTAKLKKGEVDPGEIIAAEREIGMKIAIGYLQDKFPEDSETIKNIFNTYKSGVGEKLTDKQRTAIQALVTKIQAAGIPIDIHLEGGADAQAYDVNKKDYPAYFSKMCTAAAALAADGALAGEPTVASNRALIQKIGQVTDQAGWDALVGQYGQELGKAGGALNTVLAYQRMQDAGKGLTGVDRHLFTETEETGEKYRYSLVVGFKAGVAVPPGTPGAVPPGTPGAVPPGTPGAVPPGTPGAVPPGTPGAVPPGTPGAVPPGTPGAVPPGTPGAVPPGTPGAVPPEAPASTVGALTPSTEPGKPLEFNGTEYKMEGGKYKLKNWDRPLDKDEFDIVVGKEFPSEDFMKGKLKMDFIKADLTDIKFDRSNNQFTGKYGDATNNFTVEYYISSGRSSKNALTGALAPLLTDDAKKPDNLLVTIEKLEKAGFSLSDLSSLQDIAKGDAIKEALTSGDLIKAIELLADQSTLNIPLIAEVLSDGDLDEATLQSVNRAKLDKLKPELDEIIAKFTWSIDENQYKEFKVINGADLTGDALAAVLKHPQLKNEAILILTDVTANQTNAELAKLYFDKAFDKTKTGDTNINLLAAYPEDLGTLAPTIFNFILDAANYDKVKTKLTEPKLKLALESYLKNADEKKGLPLNYQAVFEKLYDKYPVDAAAIDSNIWAKYIASNSATGNLMVTKIDEIHAAGSAEGGKFIDSLMKVFSNIGVGTIAATDVAKAKTILGFLQLSTDPQAAILAQKFITEIKKVEPTITDKVDTAKIDALYQFALNNANDASQRIAALKSFQTGGAFEAYTPAGKAPANFKEEVSKALASVYYSEGFFDDISSENLTDKLPGEPKSFMEAFAKVHAGTDLTEAEVKNLLGKADKIGAKALYALAELTDGAASPVYSMSQSHRFRILNAIGLKGKADEIVTTITEPAEKAFFEHLLRTNKKYKEMTAPEKEAARTQLTKAFDAAVATTDPATVIEIAEQMKELGDHVTQPEAQALLAKLDTKGSAFDKLADKPIDAATPADAAAKLEQDRSNDLIMRAKILRAKIEMKQCELDPSKAIKDFCEPQALITDVDSYITGKSTDKTYKLEKDMVDTLRTLNPDPTKITDPAQKKAFSNIMVRMAKESGDKTYLEKIDAADLVDPNVKADFHELNGNALEASKTRTDNPDTPANEKLELLAKAATEAKNDAEKEAVAAEYVALGTEPEVLKGVDIYLSTKNYAKVKEILAPMAGTSKVTDGAAKAVLSRIPADFDHVKMEIAIAKSWYKEILSIFDKNTATSVGIGVVNNGITDTTPNKITAKEFVDIIAKGKRTVDGAQADLDAFYNRYFVGTPAVLGVTAVPSSSRPSGIADNPATPGVDESVIITPAVVGVAPVAAVPPVIEINNYPLPAQRFIKDSLKQP